MDKLKRGAEMVFVCSPYRGDVEANVERARGYCQQVIRAGKVPFAPHLFFPQFLDDNDPDERFLGLLFGLRFIDHCDEVWVFGKEITQGMSEEIDYAEKLGKAVVRK